MWRKLGAWYWLATQNIDDLPKAAEPMLNMIEWWLCLSMPPDEVEKIARFRELSPAQKALMLSARKEAGKFTEGVILSKSMEVLFRAVPPSLYLALAQTEPEEKAERYRLMQQFGVNELEAALNVSEDIALEGLAQEVVEMLAGRIAVSGVHAVGEEVLQSRTCSLLDLEKEDIIIVFPIEKHDEASCPDTSDTHHLHSYIRDRVAVEQRLEVMGDRRDVRSV